MFFQEEGAGDDYRPGDWCRAVWGEDGLVYEAEIVKRRTVEVKFVGLGNKRWWSWMRSSCPRERSRDRLSLDWLKLF